MLFTLVHVLLHACMEYESPTQGISACVKVHKKMLLQHGNRV